MSVIFAYTNNSDKFLFFFCPKGLRHSLRVAVSVCCTIRCLHTEVTTVFVYLEHLTSLKTCLKCCQQSDFSS